MAKIAKCVTHTDCFANRNGRCVCLKDNSFAGKDCPFYKSNKAVSMDRINADCEAYAAAHGGGGTD